MTNFQPSVDIDAQIAAALVEDLGVQGDVTSAATLPSDCKMRGVIRARQGGVLAGTDFAIETFRQTARDDKVVITSHLVDGAQLKPESAVMTIDGDARAILAGERVALNFLGHLSGIATATAELVAQIADSGVVIRDTRKTTPGLRAAEKYAVMIGGGKNHRFGLYDAILIKDNHIAAAGGMINAVTAARAYVTDIHKIEVEIDAIDQIEPALTAGADMLLLDNMPPETLRQAVLLVDNRVPLEASGGVSADTIAAVAASGVEYISVGRITHSAASLDLGLDIETA